MLFKMSQYICACVGVVDLNLLREEVQMYSCTPRNFSVSLREELKRTDAIFWPSCLLVKRCGGNCACCSHHCYDCQCSPTKVAKKYHEVKPVPSLPFHFTFQILAVCVEGMMCLRALIISSLHAGLDDETPSRGSWAAEISDRCPTGTP